MLSKIGPKLWLGPFEQWFAPVKGCLAFSSEVYLNLPSFIVIWMLHSLIVPWTGRKSSQAQLQAAQLGVQILLGEVHYNCIDMWHDQLSSPANE